MFRYLTLVVNIKLCIYWIPFSLLSEIFIRIISNISVNAVLPALDNITQCTHAVCWLSRTLTAQTLICLFPQPVQQLTQIQYWVVVWLFHKCWTQSLWWTDRAHKNTAKCYNTCRSNFTLGFSITLFALDTCQVSFTWNVCRDELKTSVMCCFCGDTYMKKGV